MGCVCGVAETLHWKGDAPKRVLLDKRCEKCMVLNQFVGSSSGNGG
jgi:hypothetical protein